MYRIHSSLLRSIRPVSRPRSCSPVFSNSLRGLHLSRSSFAASELLMPALSPTMTEGTILKWLKSEGDKVEPGEVLFEVETDKAQIEVEAPDEGILAKIMVKEGGSKVKVNTVIAYLMEEGDDIATFTPPQKSQTKSAEKPKPESSKPLASTPPPPPTSPPSVRPSVELSSNMSSSTPSFQRHLSPAVYHLLKSNNLLDMADKIPASGHKGRLLKGDIISYLEGKPVEPPKKHKPMSEVPPPQPSAPSKFVSQKQLELSQVLRSRKDVDVDGILTHAVAKALRDVPDVCKAIDTSMLTLAFDSPAGLRRSNIKNLGAKSVLDVANLLKELQSGRSSETLPPNTSSVTISKSPIPSSPFSIIIGPVKKVRDTTHFQLTDTDSHNMFLDYLTGSSSSFEPEVDPEQEGLTNHSDSSNAEESKTEDLYDFLSGVAPEVESGKMKKVVDVKIDIVRDKVNESAVGKFWDRLQHYLRVAQ